MKVFTIAPKEYISERFIITYVLYTKKEAIQKYLDKFPQFKRSELTIYN
jgi:hypothetical protein